MIVFSTNQAFSQRGGEEDKLGECLHQLVLRIRVRPCELLWNSLHYLLFEIQVNKYKTLN
jgi:hypothetical protein